MSGSLAMPATASPAPATLTPFTPPLMVSRLSLVWWDGVRLQPRAGARDIIDEELLIHSEPRGAAQEVLDQTEIGQRGGVLGLYANVGAAGAQRQRGAGAVHGARHHGVGHAAAGLQAGEPRLVVDHLQVQVLQARLGAERCYASQRSSVR